MKSLLRVLRAASLCLLALPVLAQNLPELEPGPLVCEGGCAPVVADFTGDGLDDFISNNELYVNVRGAFAAPIRVGGLGVRDLVPRAGDFTNDGRADIFAFMPGVGLPPGVHPGATPDGPYRLMINQGGGEFVEKQGIGFRHVTEAVDFDVDGNLDVISTEPVGLNDSQIVLWRGHGDGTFSRAQNLKWVHPTWHGGFRSLLLGDFNEDRRPDLVVSATEYVNFFFSGPDGKFGAPVARYMGKDRGVPMVSGDINGDGNLDLVLDQQSIQVLYGDGTGHFPEVAEYSIYVAPEPPLPPPYPTVSTPGRNSVVALPIFGAADQIVVSFQDGTIVTLVASSVGQLRELDRTQVELKNIWLQSGRFREPGKLDLLALGTIRVPNAKSRAQLVYAQGRLPITKSGTSARGRAVGRPAPNRGRGGVYEVRWTGPCAPAPSEVEFQQEGIFMDVKNAGNASQFEAVAAGNDMLGVRFVIDAGGVREVEGWLIEDGVRFIGRVSDQKAPYPFACDGSPAIYSVEITPKRF